MKTIEHKLLWSARHEDEHALVLKEAQRVTDIGGSFKIENRYTDNWYSIITIFYPEGKCSE